MNLSALSKICGLLNVAENGTQTIVPFGTKYSPICMSLVVIRFVPSPVTGNSLIDSWDGRGLRLNQVRVVRVTTNQDREHFFPLQP